MATQQGVEKQRVLVVEDGADIRQVLSFFLKQAGYDVMAVAGGQEAIDILPTYRPDVIILDILMQPLSGWDVLEWVRSSHIDTTIPVLILTALVQFSDQVRGLERGAVDYITKPMQPARVVERVRQLLASSVEQRRIQRQSLIEERRQILDLLAAAQSEEI